MNVPNPPAESEVSVGASVPPDERARRPALSMELLRIAVGVVWVLNLTFVLAPQNDFFGGFHSLVLSFAPTTLGGPGLPEFVAAHAAIFSWVVAALTGYLAVAFLLGLTTRWACLAGGIFSAALLGVQVGSTYAFPGGTDVGPHPLYLIIYLALVVGGAGRSLSLDAWIATLWRRRRLTAASRARPAPNPLAVAGFGYHLFVVYFVAGTLIAFGVAIGFVVGVPGSGSVAPPAAPTYYENLTISLDPVHGWPQYSPSNFTVPTGTVVFTITDRDMPMTWGGCPCVVTGSDHNVEYVNGNATHIVSSSNVAHTFDVPPLGLSIYLPGQSVVRFSVYLPNPGSFTWFCLAPCGAGSNPYASPPMGTPGYMTGTLTIN